ncbi:MAG: SURF1 family protein [Pseudomonadota bacterium]
MTRSRRLLFLATFGLGGLALLLWLGFWQLDRLSWKQGLIAEIEARGEEASIRVTGTEIAARDDHRRAVASGAYAADEPLRYLTSQKGVGPGFRLIHAFELESGVRILVDRGFAPEPIAPRGGAAPPPPSGPQRIEGRLRWPNERSSFTPDPNRADRLWFARDVPSMAAALGAAPVLLVEAPPPGAAPAAPSPNSGPMRAAPIAAQSWPQPRAEAIDLPNNHLGYAITWFSLAAVWLVMSAFLGFRRRA